MSDDEWQPSAESDEDDNDEWQPSTNIVRRSSGRNSRKPNYTDAKIDQTFTGRTGYTHFGRTRLGGDRRPNGKPVPMPKAISTRVTMLNFFAAPGKKPLPLTRNAEVATNKKRNHVKQTRTKWGRPRKNATECDKAHAMKARVSNCKTSGELAVPPQKRQKWNGTVRTNLYVHVHWLLLTSHNSQLLCTLCCICR